LRFVGVALKFVVLSLSSQRGILTKSGSDVSPGASQVGHWHGAEVTIPILITDTRTGPHPAYQNPSHHQADVHYL
jgi:hypothetical protein